MSGAFCSACGQEYDGAGVLSTRLTFHDLIDDAIQVNRHFLRMLAELVVHPGRLTADYVAGRRTRWVSPSKLYLVVNFVAFLVGQWFDPATAKSAADLTGMAAIEAAAGARGVSVEHFSADFEDRLAGLLPSGFVALVPLFALMMMLVHAGSRRPFAAHGAFALHFAAVALLALGAGSVFAATPAAEAITWVALAALLPWLVVAMRRVYADGWLPTLIRSTLAWVCFVALVAVYFVVVVYWALATA